MNLSALLGEIPFCEQKYLPYFQEPLSVVSNIGFLVAFFFLLKERPKGVEKLLVFLILMVGLGSASYHTYRSPLTHFLDVIPIYLILMTSLFLLLKKLVLNTKTAALLLSLFIVLQASLAVILPRNFLRSFLNGSLRYVIALFVLLGIYVYAQSRSLKNQRFLLYALVSFTVAIFFRSIDILVCPVFPFGTHFLWHIFVSVTAYYTTLFLLRS